MEIKKGYLVTFKTHEEVLRNPNKFGTLWPGMVKFLGKTHRVKNMIVGSRDRELFNVSGWVWDERVIERIINPKDLPTEYREIITKRLLEGTNG